MRLQNSPTQSKKRLEAHGPSLSFSLQTGIPTDVLLQLESQLRSLKNPAPFLLQLHQQCPDLAELALEQGRYSLALELELQEPLSQIKALTFVGRKTEVQDLLSKADILKPGLAGALRSYSLRLAGQAPEALRLWQEAVIPGWQNLSLQQQAELKLHAGGLFFSLSDFSLALENYAEAFSFYSKLNRPGKMAVAAFNCSIAVGYLDRPLDANTWLWRAEEILETYPLPHLQSSIQLSRIEKRVAQGAHLEAHVLCQDFLAKGDLSMVQKVLALQAEARSCLELGLAFVAESAIAEARKFLLQYQIWQYEPFQRALEIDLEFFTGRALARPPLGQSVAPATVDQRAERDLVIAIARRCWLRQEVQKIPRAIQDLEPFAAQLPEDIQILVLQNTGLAPQTLRGFLSQCLLNLGTRGMSSLVHLQKNWRTWLQQQPELCEQSPLAKGLNQVFGGVEAHFVGNLILASRHYSEARATFERGGVDRWRSLAFGLLAVVDPHEHRAWIAYLNELGADEQQWLQAHFRRNWGLNILAGRWLVTDEATELAMADTASTQPNHYDLFFNTNDQIAWLRGEALPLKGVLLQLLQVLMQAPRVEGLAKESLAEKVWQQKYDPLVHDSLIYTTVNRLRDFVAVESVRGAYRLPPSWKIATLASGDLGADRLSSRQQTILKAAAAQKLLQRHDIVGLIQVSERTALRELSQLVALGFLEKLGSGRGVSYRKAGT